MKKQFSTKWKASNQPRKQRKYIINAPIHIKRKLLSSQLSKKLREKYTRRNIPLRKGDIVKVMRGSFKGKQGKVLEVKLKQSKVVIEGLQRSKRDGTKVNIPFKASNLQIQELNLEDKKRIKIQAETKSENKSKEKENVSKETKSK